MDDEFVVTTVTGFNETLEALCEHLSVSCVGCSSFSDSLRCLSSLPQTQSTSGWCVHVLSISDVLSAVQHSENSSYSSSTINLSAFKLFVINQQSQQQKSHVTVLKAFKRSTKYLVCVDHDESLSEDTSCHAVCILKRSQSFETVHCDSVKCKRGKNKCVKNIKQETDVCCHLRLLLAQIREQNVQTELLLSSDSPDFDNGDDEQNSNEDTSSSGIFSP